MNAVVLALTVGLAGLTQASSVGVEPLEESVLRTEAPERGAGGDQGIQPDRRRRPFEKLFIAPPAAGGSEPTVLYVPDGASKAQKPRIVCGMVVIRVDPGLDPHMVIRPKEGADTARIRRIPATACVD